MKAFECESCGQLLFFENALCERCGHALGYRSETATLCALTEADGLIIATPLGWAGGPALPAALLDALAATADDALVFDMVYVPVETALLARTRALGREVVDGIAMLIGQAGPAFELFFGVPAPRAHDAELRELLTS